MKELTLDASLENIEVVTEFVDAILEELDCPMKAQFQINIAIDELFSNIAQYAYAPETGEATVQVETEDATRTVTLTFIDRGHPFDPLSQEDPDTTLSAEERDIGGLGLLMVRKSMDDVQYERRDGQNILRVTKRL